VKVKPQLYVSHMALLHNELVQYLQVKAVNVADNGKGSVEVVTDSQTFTADYVLVTLPLAILRQNTVAFSPPLPASKLQAIQSLGVGVMEKVSFCS